MRRRSSLLLLLVLIVCCQKKEQINSSTNSREDSVQNITAPKVASATLKYSDSAENPTDYTEFINEFDILIPRSYRNWEDKVEDYKLYISAENGPETLLMEQNSFNDTFVELLFIGDLDRDGKPDFVFSANRDYEEDRVVLYLSSRAKAGKAGEKVSEIAVQFDC